MNIDPPSKLSDYHGSLSMYEFSYTPLMFHEFSHLLLGITHSHAIFAKSPALIYFRILVL